MLGATLGADCARKMVWSFTLAGARVSASAAIAGAGARIAITRALRRLACAVPADQNKRIEAVHPPLPDRIFGKRARRGQRVA